jgi:hypothetical protein
MARSARTYRAARRNEWRALMRQTGKLPTWGDAHHARYRSPAFARKAKIVARGKKYSYVGRR